MLHLVEHSYFIAWAVAYHFIVNYHIWQITAHQWTIGESELTTASFQSSVGRLDILNPELSIKSDCRNYTN